MSKRRPRKNDRAAAPPPAPDPRRPARPRRRNAALAALALLLAGAGGAAWLLSREPGEGAPGPRVVLPPPRLEAPARTVSQADFVGAETCAACHQDQYRMWQSSTHGRAGGEPDRVRLLTAFDGAPIRFRDAVVIPERVGGEHRFRVRWDGLPEQVFRVDGVIGGGHMEGGGTQGFVTRYADGTVRFLPFDFARQQGVWFCNTGTRKDQGWLPITPELSLSDCGDWPPVRVLGDLPRFATCEGCHGSQIETAMDTTTGRYRTQVKSLAINCESCHGPGREHVELARSGATASSAEIGMRPLATLDKDASLNVCFQCHALKDRLTEGYLPGERLEDHFALSFPILGDRPYTPDGRVRTFAYQQNQRYSDCYLNGSMTCVDCHDPHDQSYRDHTGVALRGRFSNGQCTSCHASKAERVEEHTRHPIGSPGSQCVSCHMPYLQHPEVGPAIQFGRSDHTIPVPRPGYDESQGIQSACRDCHQDQPVAALEARVRQWWGELKPQKELVAGLIQAQGQTDPTRVAELVLRPEEHFPMAQFAGMAHLVESALAPDMPGLAPEVVERLRALGRDRDLDVRSLALATLHYARGEDREVRALLAEELQRQGADERRVRERWVTALGYLADRLVTAGRAAEGAGVYRKALEVLPGDPRVLLNQGLALAAAGDNAGAIASYRAALAREPGLAMAWVNLGIALERHGDREGSVEAYRRAIAADPHNALPYFNLGNQMLRSRRPEEAVELYRQAAAIDPSLAQAHFYLARSYIMVGEYGRALATVRHGLKFQPNDPTGRQMLRDLETALAGP